MESLSDFSEELSLAAVNNCISNSKPFEYTLRAPDAKGRDFLKNIVLSYLKAVNKEKSHNLICLCMEEIISNSVKANIKRAYFISNNLDINNHDDYEKGMKHFKENGVGNIKDSAFVDNINKLGLYVKISFEIKNNFLCIITRNNSVISSEEIERINKKLKLSENQTPEDIFMNSIDQTEGAGLGIIMIKKIMSQVSPVEDCFSIYATDTETVTELKILI